MSFKDQLKKVKNLTIGDNKVKSPTLDMFKSSILCSVRGFVIFLLAAVVSIDSSILKDRERKNRALYAMYHNILPFIEVVAIMVPIMVCLSKTRFSNYSMLISLVTAVSICFSLRVLGIRTDCCSDMNLIKINSLNISFKAPKKGYFIDLISKNTDKEKDECTGIKKRHFVAKFFLIVVVTPLLICALCIKYLDTMLSRVISAVFFQTGNKRDIAVEKERDYFLYLIAAVAVEVLPSCYLSTSISRFIMKQEDKIITKEECDKFQSSIKQDVPFKEEVQEGVQEGVQEIFPTTVEVCCRGERVNSH